MAFYKATLSYKGTLYFGWQSQPEAFKATIQDTIHQVLRRISKYKPCKIVGASRTDAGVHAQGQVAKITLPHEIGAHELILGMNSLLPKDIRVLDCEICPREFNPVKDCKSKEYHYYFSTGNIENPLMNDIVGHVSNSLDFKLMQQGAERFIGEHDFYNFSRRDSNATTTTRAISVSEIFEVNFSPLDPSIYVLKIVGKGFLKQMVRYLAGAIFEVGQRNISPQDLSLYLRSHRQDKLSPAAKPKGLHLVKITY